MKNHPFPKLLFPFPYLNFFSCPYPPCTCQSPQCPLLLTNVQFLPAHLLPAHAHFLFALFSLPMPNSSLCCHLCKCQSPHCLLLVHLLLVNPLIALSSLSMPISSVPVSSLPSHPCPSLFLFLICVYAHLHIALLSHLAHANLISPVPVLNDANLDCFIQPTECGRFSQVSLCKMK